MRVSEIMSRPVHTVRATDAIETAVAQLATNKITAAPVLDEAGELVGIISESDLLWDRVPAKQRVLAGRDVAAAPAERPRRVADVMKGTVVTAWLEEDVVQAAQMMLEFDVRSLPVVDDAAVVGMISRRDILGAVVRTDDVVGHEVQHRLDEYVGDARRWTATVVDGGVSIDGAFDDETEKTIALVLARTVPGVIDVHLARPAH